MAAHSFGVGVITTLLIFRSFAGAAEMDPSPFEAGIQKRRAEIIQSVSTTAAPPNHPKYSSYDYLARAAKLGCLDAADTNQLIENLDETSWVKKDKTVSRNETAIRTELVFALPPISRYILQFRNCLSQEQLERIKQTLEAPRQILEHGTINHWSMRASSLVLLSQAFPTIVWTDISTGKHFSASDLANELSQVLKERYLKFFADGHTEQFSPVYQAVNFMAALNLADLAADQELRNLASNSLTTMLASLSANSFHGQIVPPITRANFPQRSGLSPAPATTYTITQPLLWFYFGEPLVSQRDLRERVEPIYAIMYAISAWRPPREVLEIPRFTAKGYELYTSTPTFSKWAEPTSNYVDGSAYITNNFAIGVGNGRFETSSYNGSNRFFSIFFKSTSPANSIECYHSFWNGKAGIDAWRSDQSSPFQEQWRDGRRIAIVARIPDADPWPQDLEKSWGRLREPLPLKLLQCRIPNPGTEIERADDRTVFVRAGAVSIGIKLFGDKIEMSPSTAKGYDGMFTTIRIVGSSLAAYIEVSDATQQDIATFKAQFSRDVSFNAQKSALSFLNEANKNVTVTYARLNDPDGYIRSVPIVEQDGAVFERPKNVWLDAPFLRIGGGRFTLRTEGGLYEIVNRNGQLEVSRNGCAKNCGPPVTPSLKN